MCPNFSDINKHDSRINPGNRCKDICRGRKILVTSWLPGQRLTTKKINIYD